MKLLLRVLLLFLLLGTGRGVAVGGVSAHIEEVSSLTTVEKTALKKQYEAWKMLGVVDELDDLSNAFINGWTKEQVLAIPKGSRPDPITYLKAEYITNHLNAFDGGVTKITSYNPIGTVGPPGGTFVLPKSIADGLIYQSGGDINKLEELLGLNRGDLGPAPYRIDVTNPSGLRMPTGNELGANEFWLPGGKTSGGILEATVDQIQQGTYSAQSIF